MVALWICGLSCLCMILSVLFFPKLRLGKLCLDTYWLVVLAGAVVMLATGQVTLAAVKDSFFSDSAINPLKILVLFLSMTMLSVFLDEVGFFRYLANAVLKKAGASQKKLFVILYLTVSVLTVFTSNDIIVLTFTPFLCYFAKNAKIDPLPYLFSEFIAANTMSMTLIIGNPTNIYLATANQVDFLTYARVMVLPTLAASAVAFAVLWLLFRRRLSQAPQGQPEEVALPDKTSLWVGLAHLLVCTVLLAIGSYINLPMWLVAAVSALSLLLVTGVISCVKKQRFVYQRRTLRRAPWALVPFVLSMFILVLGLSSQGVTEQISAVLGDSAPVWKYGGLSLLAANLINNIPMSVLFSDILAPLADPAKTAAVYATVIGSNLGAYLTPIGALAGIMWSALLKEQGVRLRYGDFVRYGAAVALPTAAAAFAVLALVLL